MTSQVNFDQPTLYDPILNQRTGTFSDIWIGYWSYFYQTLISYISSNGYFLSNLSQTEINGLQKSSLMNGQLLYNITVDAPQFWQSSADDGAGAWRTISFT